MNCELTCEYDMALTCVSCETCKPSDNVCILQKEKAALAIHCATMSRPHHGTFNHEQIHCERRPLSFTELARSISRILSGRMTFFCALHHQMLSASPSHIQRYMTCPFTQASGTPFPKIFLGDDGTEIQKLTGKPDKIVSAFIRTMICCSQQTQSRLTEKNAHSRARD